MSARLPRRSVVVSAALGAILILLAGATPGLAHWADLAVAEIVVGETTVRMILVFPTGLVAAADEDRDGHLSEGEVRAHQTFLQAMLAERIRLTDGVQDGTLTVESTFATPSNLTSTPGSHTTLILTYTWPRPIERMRIHYGLFLPGVSTASCLATILRDGRIQTFVFTPTSRQVSFEYGTVWTRLWRRLTPRNVEWALLAGFLAVVAGLGYAVAAARRPTRGPQEGRT